MKIFFILLLLSSCANLISSKGPKEGKKTYTYVDVSGRYSLVREYKVLKNKIVTRNLLTSDMGSTVRPLEKSVIVSQVGNFKDGKRRQMTVRPYGSEFTVWLEGKRYSSQMRLNPKTRSMVMELDSPEARWKGQKSVPYPKGKQFCFFSQIPECLYHNQFLNRALNNKKGAPLGFYVIWDGFPFIQDQLTDVGNNLFSPATLVYDGIHQKSLRYQVEVDGQTVLYHFSKAFDLVKILWIGQGLSILPPGEEIPDADE